MMFMREKEFDMRNSLSNSLVIMFQTMAINFRWMSKILIQKTLLSSKISRRDLPYCNFIVEPVKRLNFTVPRVKS